MTIRRTLAAIRWSAISAVHKRRFFRPDAEPVVSFTFDDFPRSALTVGGEILKNHGVCGTYYAAFGLMGKTNALGEQFCAEDIPALLRDGHELGSHTYSHVSGRLVSIAGFEADVKKGRAAVEQVAGTQQAHHFSYPYGHATLLGKGRIGAAVSSCRGILRGINESPVDLNLLRANSLYSWGFDLDVVGRLLKENERRRGWLIFYTHDVCERPSEFGCLPVEFECVVKLALKSGSRITRVGHVIATICQRTEAQQYQQLVEKT